MKKLYDKDEVWFAVLWIILYVLGFGNGDSLSEAIGFPKLLTVIVGLLFSAILFLFVKRNVLFRHVGLCRITGEYKKYGYFIPLILISCVNLWHGFAVNTDLSECILFAISMCFVGFLEELIFRGFLFQGMLKTNATAAILVSSLTFGFGHIVNLLLGADLFETLLQLVYASAIGFCYTVVFYTSGSIVPCIVSHIFVNVTSVFAAEPTNTVNIILTVVQTVLGVGYGLWLLRQKKTKEP